MIDTREAKFDAISIKASSAALKLARSMETRIKIAQRNKTEVSISRESAQTYVRCIKGLASIINSLGLEIEQRDD